MRREYSRAIRPCQCTTQVENVVVELCGGRGNALVLATLMTKEVVATREALDVRAAFDVTVIGDLGRSLFHVLSLMTDEVFRVKKPLTTDRASMRPLIRTEMDFKMATTNVNRAPV